MNRETCPSRDVLLAYETAQLPESSVQPLIAHLSICPACQAELETLCEGNDTLIARLRKPPTADPYEAEPECREAVLRMEQLAAQASSVRDLPNAEAVEPTIVGQLGEYELLEKLGEGGMGVVYKARHTKLKRLVALKVLPKARVHHEGTVARFEREMEAIGRVNHPNIVQAHDAREIDGERFLVMEYVDGLDLDALVRRHGPLPIPDACELIRQAAVGLQYAHEHGLIHRDIKPSNLMLSREGQVKILDLGLALLKADQPVGNDTTAAQPANTELTNSQQIMGTASYMAPEQASDSHQVDTRADIYSLGCTLYKLLTGRPPFAGADCRTPLDQILAHRSKPVEPIGHLRSEVPAELAGVIERMLAKNPADRFATPAEVAEALKPWTAGQRSDRAVGRRSCRAESGTGSSGGSWHFAPESFPPDRPGGRRCGSDHPARHRDSGIHREGHSEAGVCRRGSRAAMYRLHRRRCDSPGKPRRADQAWPGKHTLRVKHGDLEIETREFAVVRGGNQVLRVSLPSDAELSDRGKQGLRQLAEAHATRARKLMEEGDFAQAVRRVQRRDPIRTFGRRILSWSRGRPLVPWTGLQQWILPWEIMPMQSDSPRTTRRRGRVAAQSTIGKTSRRKPNVLLERSPSNLARLSPRLSSRRAENLRQMRSVTTGEH